MVTIWKETPSSDHMSADGGWQCVGRLAERREPFTHATHPVPGQVNTTLDMWRQTKRPRSKWDESNLACMKNLLPEK